MFNINGGENYCKGKILSLSVPEFNPKLLNALAGAEI